MTQSKKTDEYSITLNSGETIDLSSIIDTTGDIVIDLNNTYGATTTYTYDSNLYANDTITISDGTFSIDTNGVDWLHNDKRLDPSEIERMCDQYPALEKVWRNFKSVYDMCKQDYEGKKKAGELDDDIPF